MISFLENWVILQELGNKRGQAGKEVIGACVTTADAGMAATDRIAKGAVESLSNASMIMIIGLVAALAVGVLAAFFITRSITGPVNRIISGLNEGANQVASASGQVSSSSQSMAEGASQQAASIEETSSSMEEMASMTKKNAENAGNADGLMIGRGAQGRPWIFQELMNGLQNGSVFTPLAKIQLRDIMLGHLEDMHRFYGESTGIRVARKHLTWYCQSLVNADEFRYEVVRVRSAEEQLRLTREYFDREGGGISIAA